jgi:hypothetical protein
VPLPPIAAPVPLPPVAAPVSSPPPAPEPAPASVERSYDGLAAQLQAVDDRDQIPPIIIGYLSSLLGRAVLFSVKKRELVGWHGHGRRLRRETVEASSFSLERPSVFQRAVDQQAVFAGALPHEETEESLVIRLGADDWPEHALVIPVTVKGRVVAILYGEAASAETLAAAREPAEILCGLMAETFVRLILEKKKG